MRRSCPSGTASPADDRPALHTLSYVHVETRKVSIVCCNAAAVINYDQVSVSVIPARKLHNAFLAGAHRITPARFDVYARMEFCPTCEGISTIAERASNADV